MHPLKCGDEIQVNINGDGTLIDAVYVGKTAHGDLKVHVYLNGFDDDTTIQTFLVLDSEIVPRFEFSFDSVAEDDRAQHKYVKEDDSGRLL